MEADYLSSVQKQFEYYKILGERTIDQVPEDQLFWQFNDDSNSIATIVKHLSGNMISRWTDFLTSDGEKETRNRESEFDNDVQTKDELLELWNAGWKCFLDAIYALKADDMSREVFIRNQGHTVTEAINRQLAHYPYHIGQIVFIGKMVCGDRWASLSIPRGKSDAYNADKFSQAKHKEHFTTEFTRKGN